MSAQAIHLASQPRPANLRPFDVRRDLLAVADLVELCFAPSLDSDGHAYIRQMRQAARAGRWLPQPLEGDAPLMGMVWVEDGVLVGNLNLIPQPRGGHTRYLIANVAVHPAYQRRGIAQQLTLAALDDLRARGGPETWLQVDQTNATAVHLYQRLGFVEKLRRTSWRGWPPDRPARPAAGVRSRQAHDWPQQSAWLKHSYPADVRWQLPLNLAALQPGLQGSVHRLFGPTRTLQWSAQAAGSLRAVLTWQRTNLEADRLWLAAAADDPQPPLAALLAAASRHLEPDRKLALNYPAGLAIPAFDAAGFTVLRTLIWMRFPWEDSF
jgi:ribosomal protein S18 acetylase RimI-like enzyme